MNGSDIVTRDDGLLGLIIASCAEDHELSVPMQQMIKYRGCDPCGETESMASNWQEVARSCYEPIPGLNTKQLAEGHFLSRDQVTFVNIIVIARPADVVSSDFGRVNNIRMVNVHFYRDRVPRIGGVCSSL